MSGMAVKLVSECFIKPNIEVTESKKPHHLSPYDLQKLSSHYIQKGLLFTKPSHDSNNNQPPPYSTRKFLEDLKQSLSRALVEFYPLAGQLVTELDEHQKGSFIFVDCNKGPGAKFIYATLDVTISSIISPVRVPLVVQSLFDHHKAQNHEGHTRPLLSVQVTELIDGIFIGCSANHAVVDGTTYWRFWNMWSEIHISPHQQVAKPCLPIYERWFPDGCGLNNPVVLPFTHPDEFISCLEPPQLEERIFHFSTTSIQRLKTKANEQRNTNEISSFQALSALVWRSIIRANCIGRDQVTTCRMTASNRHRFNPPLPPENFGNCVSLLETTTTAGELLERDLGWAASLIHQSIHSLNEIAVRDYLQGWLQTPSVPLHGSLYSPDNVLISSSPRFNMYGNEFGLGKAKAVRSGYANKFHGKVTSYPGCEGGGSVELEICLPPDSMSALESDIEFMDAVSLE